MSGSSWQRVSEIADELLDLESSELEAELDRRCAGDAELAAAVRKLVIAAREMDTRTFMSEAAGASLEIGADPLAAGLCGASIEGFQLLRVIAEGGMGVVFEARQARPERSVAIKVLRPAFATKAAVRRFEVESEILARMQHPSIARVIASGVHRFAGGGLAFELPWYAMELLEGARDLVSYSRDSSLSLDERLALFQRACEAVHHAHQRGVIHRDLKPGNILVDARGEAKVIDFGIARASDAGGATRFGLTAGTRAHDLLGTLRYMAPEQVDGRADRVDVRTDVYALGVVLFELVTGASPIAVDDSTLDQALRAIQSDPPKIPSHVVPSLPREIDWIVDRCLAKDANDRYDSVAELIADLERLRREEPLSVGPRDLRYRLRVFVRRNRVGVIIAAAIVLLLSGWIASLGSALGRARSAESEASLRADEADREAGKLRAVRDYFGVAVDRARRRGNVEDLSFRQVIDELERALGSHDMPLEVAAVLAADVARFRIELDQGERAIELLEPMIARLDAAGLGSSFEAKRVHTILASARQRVGDTAAARDHVEAAHAIDIHSTVTGAVDITQLQVEWERVRQLIAEEKFAQGEERLRVLLAPFDAGAPDPMNNAQTIRGALAVVLTALGRYDEAEPFARDALAAEITIHGEESPRAANAMTALAIIRAGRGEFEEARRLVSEASSILEAQLSPEHRFVLSAREQMALCRQRQGALDEALAILEDVLPKRRGAEARWDRESLLTVSRIGQLLCEMRRFAEAESRIAQALSESESALGIDHPLRIVLGAELGKTLVFRGRSEEGVAMLEDAARRLAYVEGKTTRVEKLRSWGEKARAGTLTPGQ